jgi:hypothetical protein
MPTRRRPNARSRPDHHLVRRVGDVGHVDRGTQAVPGRRRPRHAVGAQANDPGRHSAAEPIRRSVDHLDDTRVRDRAGVLLRHTDHQVGASVTIDVADLEHRPEPVPALHGLTRVRLGHRALLTAPDPPGDAVPDVDDTRLRDATDIRIRVADGRVDESVAVEVRRARIGAGRRLRKWPGIGVADHAGNQDSGQQHGSASESRESRISLCGPQLIGMRAVITTLSFAIRE